MMEQQQQNQQSQKQNEQPQKRSDFKSRLKKLFKSREFKIWAIGMAIVIIVAVSIMSVVMATKSIKYGLAISVDSVDKIQIRNSNLTSGNYLHNGRSKNETAAIREIIGMLNSSGKSNEFLKFFLGHGGTERAGFSEYLYENSLKSASVSNGVYIQIVFKHELYCIVTENGEPKIKPYDTTKVLDKSIRISSIIIPLGNAKNSFQTQTWYFHLGDYSNDTYKSIDRKLTTYGNYKKLANYIIDKDMDSFDGIFYNKPPENVD